MIKLSDSSHYTNFPKNLLIETTTRCNLRCKQCARLEDKYALADMELDTFQRLQPLFPHLKEVALYGHGETFLHKQFFTMLETLKKYAVFVYVTTNGTLINDTTARRLVELQLDRLSFSLDAATPELFNEIRRGANFEKILENIRRINRFKKLYKRDDKPALSIMFCAMKSTIQELPKLVRLADQLNMTHGIAVLNITEYEAVKGERITRYPEVIRQYVNQAHLLAEQLAIPMEITGALQEYVTPVRLTFWDRLWRNYREFQRSFNRRRLFTIKFARMIERFRYWRCSQRNMIHSKNPVESPKTSALVQTIRVKDCRDPWDFMFVNVHGDVRVCCVSHRIMGNIHSQTVDEIWNGPAYHEFRQKMLTTHPPEECLSCPARGWHDIVAADA